MLSLVVALPIPLLSAIHTIGAVQSIGQGRALQVIDFVS